MLVQKRYARQMFCEIIRDAVLKYNVVESQYVGNKTFERRIKIHIVLIYSAVG